MKDAPPRSPLPASAESELAKERTFGGDGVEVDREIRSIDLADFDERRTAIDEEIWSAATDIGFFQVTGHGIEQPNIDAAFALSERFFALPTDVKQRRPLRSGTNSGWEFKTQNRPSTGTLDQKESYQITMPLMDDLDLWPTEVELEGFRQTMTAFEEVNWRLAMRILSCFARKLGFADDFFTTQHDPASPHYQSTLRLLNYLPVAQDELDGGYWRAGAHTDYDCLTLLHQVPGQHGLQLCPGADAAVAADVGRPLGWTSVDATPGAITCNIGDMLMRWSDDRLPSTLHRVRMPQAGEYLGARHSIAFFAQANRDAIVQGPSGRYAPISAADYLQQRIAANFSG